MNYAFVDYGWLTRPGQDLLPGWIARAIEGEGDWATFHTKNRKCLLIQIKKEPR